MNQSDKLYKNAVKNMVIGFAYYKIITDKKGKPINFKCLDVNRAFLEKTGLKAKDIVGKTISQIFPKTSKEKADWIKLCGKVALLNQKQTVEQYFKTFKRWLRVDLFSPSKGYFVTGLIDITKRKLAEESLWQSFEKYRSLVHNVNIGVYRSQPGQNGRFIEVNPALVRMLGYKSAKELMQQPINGIYENPDVRISFLKSIKQKGFARPGEVRLKKKDGTVITTFVTSSVHRDNLGKIDWIDGVIEDITERKQQEDALHRREAILEAVAFAADRFLKSADWESSIQEILARLGNATQVSRVYIFEKHLSPAGRLLTSQRHEWVSEKITPQIDNPLMQNFDIVTAGFTRWEKTLTKGKVLHGNIRDFPVRERKILSTQNILSIAVVPIFTGQTLWGFIGFDECVKERKWTQIEIDSLKAAASIFGSAIQEKQVEKGLRESEEKYRSLINNINVGIYRFDGSHQGEILEANPAMAKLLGYKSVDELKYASVVDLYQNPNERKKTLKKLRKFGFIKNEEKHLKRKDGTPIIASATAHAQKDDMGKIAWINGALEDITERKRAEQALKQSEEKYRSLVQNVNIGIYRNSPVGKGKFIEVNPSIVHMLGYDSPKELLKLSVVDLYQNPKDRKFFLKTMKKNGLVPGGEFKLKRKDGSLLMVRIFARAHHNDQGEIDWIDGVIEDITERKKDEEALHRREVILEAIALAAKRFLQRADWKSSIQEILARIGKTAQVSRVYIFEKHTSQDGRLLTSQRYEWVAKGIIAQIDNPLMQNLDVKTAGFGRWIKILSKNQTLYGNIRDFPASERKFLSAQNILSIALVPIFCQKALWGFIGFDDCLTERKWTQIELDTLKAAASIIGSAIQQQLTVKLLGESEKKYRSLVENVNTGIYRNTADPSGIFIEANPAMCRIFGYDSAEELKQLSVAELYQNSDDRKAFIKKITKYGLVKNEELRLKKKDGTLIIASVTARAHRDKTGKIDWFDGVIEDITKRKQAIESLRESEERYRTVFETANDGIVIITPDGRVISANKRILDLAGLSEKDIGSPLSKYGIIPPNSLAIIQEKMRQRLAGKEIGPYEVELHPKEGKPKIIEINATLLRDANGKVIGDLSIIRDITERKRAMQALRESEQKFRTLVEKSQDLVILRDASDNIKYVNPACRTILGYGQEDLIGKSPNVFRSLFHPDDRELSEKKLASALDGIPCSNIEYRITTKDGRVKWLNHSRTPIIENEKVIMTIGVIRDITEQKQAEKLLKVAKESAEVANKVKTAFLANMSHELRTPMHSILGFTDILLEKEENGNKERKELLGIVKNSSDKLLHIINELLDLSRIESGKMIVEKKEFNIINTAKKLQKIYQPLVQTKGLIFNIKINKNLPELICSDELKIEQIITNLLNNSLKYTHKGKIELYLGMLEGRKLAKNEGILEYYVKDTGIGIEPKKMSSLFEQYLQTDAYLTRITPGARLGLAIVKQLIDLMKGQISVKSTIGKGTKSIIRQPIRIVGMKHEK